MAKMEFHAATGGADSEKFASELAASVAKFADRVVEADGRVLTISHL